MENCRYDRAGVEGTCKVPRSVAPSYSGELQICVGEHGGCNSVRENGDGPHHRIRPSLQKKDGQRKLLVLLDVLCLAVASVPFLVCEISAVKPVKRGFYCDDYSIKYPHIEKETVNDVTLVAVGVTVSVIAITIVETYRICHLKEASRSFVTNPYLSRLYKEIGAFLFGCTVGQSLTNMAKLAIGRLRPHFLAVCRPDFSTIDCSAGYVYQYNCTGNSTDVTEARKSFYSGHASFAMYSMLYLAFYVQARFTWQGARLLRPVTQFMLIIVALFTGFSRISDYRHHPTDVLVGFVQGALVAYWVAFHISSMFKYRRHKHLQEDTYPESPMSTDC
ncbi:phospholipid phosphatase 3-like [Protopterus annectens]|uniref:phospholipid phosphatase 3-like n=1 Tax=Protopterus annectens TaxID=7888 RepID=UPI001CFAB1F4|nr:phospholipid phosphatase 3-like [Protopterus annectens]